MYILVLILITNLITLTLTCVTSTQVFMEHANKLIEVADMACSMSSCEEGIKMVQLATEHMRALAPEVVNAARILAARPSSKVALDNMMVFKVSQSRVTLSLSLHLLSSLYPLYIPLFSISPHSPLSLPPLSQSLSHSSLSPSYHYSGYLAEGS